MTANVEPTADPLAVLHRLHTQLRILVSAVTIAPDSIEVATMFAGLVETTGQATAVLTATDPETLGALRRAFGYARNHQHNEATSELVHAHGRLSLLLHRDTPCRRAPVARDAPRGYD